MYQARSCILRIPRVSNKFKRVEVLVTGRVEPEGETPLVYTQHISNTFVYINIYSIYIKQIRIYINTFIYMYTSNMFVYLNYVRMSRPHSRAIHTPPHHHKKIVESPNG